MLHKVIDRKKIPKAVIKKKKMSEISQQPISRIIELGVPLIVLGLLDRSLGFNDKY